MGRDPRISGDILESALIAGVCSQGVDAVLAGVIPIAGRRLPDPHHIRAPQRSRDIGLAQLP